MTTIDTRRTIRRYKNEDVPQALLDSLLTKAARTQTMGNLQLYSVVETRSAAGKAALSPAHFGQPMVEQAPVVLTICADFRRTSLWCECREAQPGYDNLLSFLNAATDALLYCQTFCCLAEEAGLGLCFLGTTVYMPEMIIEALKLPRLVMPVATLTVGWPDEQPPLTDRLALPAFLHTEAYQDYSPADIDRHYEYKESLPENIAFCRENAKQTLAQVFAEVRYTKADNEAMSEGLMRALRRQGFIDY